jgi:hypothetical protein
MPDLPHLPHLREAPDASSPAGHAFDAAIALAAADGGGLEGHTSPAYANMVGPYGGITAATLLNAVCIDPARLGDPLALTVNFAGPIADGSFHIDARAVRTNRSTQHWTMSLRQGEQIAATATAVFGLRRETWSSTELGFPLVPPFDALPQRAPRSGPAWLAMYDQRFVHGSFPDLSRPEHENADSTTCLWMRDQPLRPLDFVSLAALCDVFYPRIYRRRPRFTPAGTVSLTVYFHADAPLLAAQGTQAVLGQARAQRFRHGFFDQSAEVWSHDGALLATTHQIVYFKQ